MAGETYRIGVVGASSLAGKELADNLNESSFASSTLVLLDDDDLLGTMTSAGDEAAFIQKLDDDSFDGMDFVFFAGNPEMTKTRWQSARAAGASIVDLTYALTDEKNVAVRAPWLVGNRVGVSNGLSLATSAIIAAHPVATMLALIAGRVLAVGLKSMAATVMEPASEHGRGAMDELQQQTINLLSFQPLPKEQYDAQVAFNLLTGLGDTAKIHFAATGQRILKQYTDLGEGRLPELALQLVQAPVFHGYTVSLLIEVASPATIEQVEASLTGPYVDVLTADSEPPSNLTAAGQGDFLVRVTAADSAGTRFWIWIAADNIRMHTLNAIACAVELQKLRPDGRVQ
jgi:aspartate-semialdehyde dehydrogenase